MKIYYLAPDNLKPCGGIYMMYQHVKALTDAGVDAWLVHEKPGFKCLWINIIDQVRILDREQARQRIEPEDYVVVPDTELNNADFYFNTVGRKIAFIQGQTTFSLTPEAYKQLNYQRVISCSQTVSSAVSRKLGQASIIVSNYVEDIFKPGKKIQNSVAYMPRKNTETLASVVRMIRQNYPGMIFLPIENRSVQEVADILSLADCFISTTYEYEGFGLPMLEAMASGCVVIGQTGNVREDFIQNNHTLFASDFFKPHALEWLNNFYLFDKNAKSIYARFCDAMTQPDQKNLVRENGLTAARKYDKLLFISGIKQLISVLLEAQ